MVALFVVFRVLDRGDAVGEEFASEDEDVEQSDDRDGETDLGEGEHPESERGVGFGYRQTVGGEVAVDQEFGDDDIGGGPDECADASEDGREGQGHIELGW